MDRTSANLVQLLRENGPLPTSAVFNAYSKRYRECLNLQGRGLRRCMSTGLLPGVVYRDKDNVRCLAAENAEENKAAGGGLVKNVPTAASSAPKKEKDIAVSKQKAEAKARAIPTPQPTIGTSGPKESVEQNAGETGAARVVPVDSAQTAAASAPKKEGHVGVSEQNAGARAHAMSAPHSAVETSGAKELAVPGRLTATNAASHTPAAIQNTDHTVAAGGQVNGVSTAAASSAKKKKKKVKLRRREKAAARAQAMSAPEPPIETSYSKDLAATIMEEIEAAGVGRENSIASTTASPPKKKKKLKKGHAEHKKQKASAKAQAMSAPHPAVATSKAGKRAAKTQRETEAARKGLVNGISTATASSPKKKKFKKGHVEVNKQKAAAQAHATSSSHPAVAASKAEELAAQTVVKTEAAAGSLANGVPTAATSSPKKEGHVEVNKQKAAETAHVMSASQSTLPKFKAKELAAQKAAETEAGGGGLVNSVPSATASPPNEEEHVKVSEHKASARSPPMSAPHSTVAASRPEELTVPGRPTVGDAPLYTPVVKQNTEDIETAKGGMANSIPTAAASSYEEKGHVELSEQKAGARAPTVSASHHTIGTSRATELAAQNRGETVAAGGRPVNSVPTAAASTANAREHVNVGKHKVGASAHARAEQLAVPGVLMVTDTASYTTAVERFGPRAKGIGAKTLMQACGGRAVGLGVVQEGADDKITGALTHIQVANESSTVIDFDLRALGRNDTESIVSRDLCEFLSTTFIMKVTHDVARISTALKLHFGPAGKLVSVLDTQLAYEALGYGVFGSVQAITNTFSGQEKAPYLAAASRARPGGTKGCAAQRAAPLIKVFGKIQANFTGNGEEWESLLHASQMRADFAAEELVPDRYRMTFCDHGSTWAGGVGKRLISYELKLAKAQAMQGKCTVASGEESSEELPQHTPQQAPSPKMLVSTGPNAPNWMSQQFAKMAPWAAKLEQGRSADARSLDMTEVDDENSPLEVLKLVPRIFREELLSQSHTDNLDSLQELVLDEGARPMAHVKDRGRIYLCSNEKVVVTKEHIKMIVGDLDRQGRIGDDNRAGFPGQLHRLSVMRDKTRRIYGVTLRIGRFFRGSAGIIDDLLFYPSDINEDTPRKAPSLLILGAPGSGKTTVIREISRKLSMSQTVVIVDTSNEIAGDGAIPHRGAIGHSRRLMVPSKDHQHRVMIEALQNHTPQTIVVDELSNTLEAKACMDIKARGVRLVASAHGDLQSLLNNPAMNTLVGGKESVTLGDSLAQKSNGGQKVLVQRAGAPIFDTIIELKRGKVNTWTIIQNVGRAVDSFLNGEAYDVQRRVRIEDEVQGLKRKGAVCDTDVSFFMRLDKEERIPTVYY